MHVLASHLLFMPHMYGFEELQPTISVIITVGFVTIDVTKKFSFATVVSVQPEVLPDKAPTCLICWSSLLT